MRVVLSHSDPDHPNAAPFAYRLGRAQDGTNFVAGEEQSSSDTIDTLVGAAQKEYPDYAVSVEALISNGETSEWVAAVKQNGQWVTPSAAGAVVDAELAASVSTQADRS